jgi:cytoskeletal protein RodZ
MTDTNVNEPQTSTAEGLDEAKLRFGEWLRGVREQAGLSIDSVAYETKIGKNYLLSLESGDLDALPGKVFGRGFVKCITRLLKTDGAEGLRLYDACWDSNIISMGQDGDDTAVEVHKTRSVMARIAEPVNTSSPVTKRLMGGGFSPAGEKPRLPSLSGASSGALNFQLPTSVVRGVLSPYVRMWALVGILTVFVGLVFGRWAASHWHKSRLAGATVGEATLPVATSASGRQMAPQESTEDADVATGTQAVAPVLNKVSKSAVGSTSLGQLEQLALANPASTSKVSAKSLAKNEDAPLYMPSDSVGAFEQVLEMKVANPVEIRLTIDGKKIENTWYKSDSYRFTFNSSAELYLLDASEVDVVYNGTSLGVLGAKGRKRRIYFQAKASSSDFPQ